MCPGHLSTYLHIDGRPREPNSVSESRNSANEEKESQCNYD